MDGGAQNCTIEGTTFVMQSVTERGTQIDVLFGCCAARVRPLLGAARTGKSSQRNAFICVETIIIGT